MGDKEKGLFPGYTGTDEEGGNMNVETIGNELTYVDPESYSKQLAARNQSMAQIHESVKENIQATQNAIKELSAQFAIESSAQKADALTKALVAKVNTNNDILADLIAQQYGGEQLANLEDSILAKALKFNADLFATARQDLYMAIGQKGSLKLERDNLASELEKAQQIASDASRQLELKEKELENTKISLITQNRELNKKYTEAINGNSSALTVTQQEVTLAIAARDDYRTQLEELQRTYNNKLESTRLDKVSHELTIARLTSEKENAITLLKTDLAFSENRLLDTQRLLAKEKKNTEDRLATQKQLALSQVNSFEKEKEEYFANLKKLENKANESQTKLLVLEGKYQLITTNVNQLKYENENLSKRLESAEKKYKNQKDDLLGARERVQEELSKNQLLSQQVTQLQSQLQSQLSILNVGDESINQQLAIRDEEVAELQKLVDATKRQLSTTQQEIGEKVREEKASKEIIANLKQLNQTITESIEETNEKYKKQRDTDVADIERLSNAERRLQKEVEDANKIILDQTQFITVSQNDEAVKLRKDLENATKKNREDFFRISTLERIIEENDRAITLSNSKLDQEELERELLRVQTELENEKTRATQLEIKLANTQKRINEHNTLDKELQSRSDALQQELERTQRLFLDATNSASKLAGEKLDLFKQLTAIDSNLNRIQLYELDNDQIRPLIGKLDANDTENSQLIRSNMAMRLKIEKDIQHAKALNAMQVFTGAKYRKVDEPDFLRLDKYVLASKILIDGVIKTLDDRDKSGNSSTNTTRTTTTISTTTTTKRTPTIALGASALHSLNQFEMIAQTEWLSLSRQLSEPGEYSVEIAFGVDGREEFHFLMRDVRLLANPNDTAGGERFFVVDLTSPSDRVIYGLGSMGVADVIYARGEVNIIVREKKSNTIVKQETLAYEFVPQKNLQYNTKVSARVDDSITIHARYLGTSYIIEDILIRQ